MTALNYVDSRDLITLSGNELARTVRLREVQAGSDGFSVTRHSRRSELEEAITRRYEVARIAEELNKTDVSRMLSAEVGLLCDILHEHVTSEKENEITRQGLGPS